MSSLNVLPSAPPEKLYPELLPDNFRLSRIGNIDKKISEKIENYRKVANRPSRTTLRSVWALSRPLSRLLASS